MNDINVRRAVVGDINGIAMSNAALFAEDGAARDRLRNRHWPAQHGEQWCADLLEDPDALVLVAADDDVVIGHLIGSFSHESEMWVAPRAELVSMQVNDGYRGGGLGSTLVEGFREWARARGAVRMQVTAYIANEPAVHFYSRHGFKALSVELATDLRQALRVRSASRFAAHRPAGRRVSSVTAGICEIARACSARVALLGSV